MYHQSYMARANDGKHKASPTERSFVHPTVRLIDLASMYFEIDQSWSYVCRAWQILGLCVCRAWSILIFCISNLTKLGPRCIELDQSWAFVYGTWPILVVNMSDLTNQSWAHVCPILSILILCMSNLTHLGPMCVCTSCLANLGLMCNKLDQS